VEVTCSGVFNQTQCSVGLRFVIFSQHHNQVFYSSEIRLIQGVEKVWVHTFCCTNNLFKRTKNCQERNNNFEVILLQFINQYGRTILGKVEFQNINAVSQSKTVE